MAIGELGFLPAPLIAAVAIHAPGLDRPTTLAIGDDPAGTLCRDRSLA
jgi:hypothetical protein